MISCILSGCILFCGCGSKVNWDITDSAIEIEDTNINEYVNPYDKEDAYIYVEINGTMYLPYGVQGERITSDMIGKDIEIPDFIDDLGYDIWK